MTNRKLRTGMGIASAVLLGIAGLIVLFAHGWVRYHFGDGLVVMMLYTMARTVFPEKPRYGLLLPAAILLFAFGMEFLQYCHFCDIVGITSRFLRLCIGVSGDALDLPFYVICALPCFICELLLRRNRTACIHEPEQAIV